MGGEKKKGKRKISGLGNHGKNGTGKWKKKTGRKENILETTVRTEIP